MCLNRCYSFISQGHDIFSPFVIYIVFIKTVLYSFLTLSFKCTDLFTHGRQIYILKSAAKAHFTFSGKFQHIQALIFPGTYVSNLTVGDNLKECTAAKLCSA